MPAILQVLGRQRLVNYDGFPFEARGIAHKIFALWLCAPSSTKVWRSLTVVLVLYPVCRSTSFKTFQIRAFLEIPWMCFAARTYQLPFRCDRKII